MATEQNKALVRRFVEEVLNQRKVELVDELVTPDYTEHNAPPGVQPGIEGLRQGLTQYLAAFPDLQITIEDQVAEGERVVGRYTTRGTHQGPLFGIPPTGKQVTYSTIDIVRVAGGKLAERWSVDDQLGLLQQLGVLPAPGGEG